jgi:hypothetical protein
MEKYKGMNFQEWCGLDETDKRKINYTIAYTQAMQPVTAKFTSEDKVDRLMMHRIRNSIIDSIKLINNEWYVELIY